MSEVRTAARVIVRGDAFDVDTDFEHIPNGFSFGVLYVGDTNTIFIHDLEAAVSLAKAASEIVEQFAAYEAAKTETTTEGGEQE